MKYAAAQGNLEVVKWLQENRTEGCTDYAMNWAVKWLHENRTEGCTINAMDLSAKNGHLDIVKWLQENYPLLA